MIPTTQLTYSGTTTGQGTTAAQTASQQQNQYTAGQTALQNQLGGLWQSLLSGNVPTSFTAPQSVINSYLTNFSNSVAPGLAAQYGAGSPQIASQESLGLTNLLGNTYSSGLSGYESALGGASNVAYGMPTGTSGVGSSLTNQAATSNTNSAQTQSTSASLLGTLLSLMALGG